MTGPLPPRVSAIVVTLVLVVELVGLNIWFFAIIVSLSSMFKLVSRNESSNQFSFLLLIPNYILTVLSCCLFDGRLKYLALHNRISKVFS